MNDERPVSVEPCLHWQSASFLRTQANASIFFNIQDWGSEQFKDYADHQVFPDITPSFAFAALGLIALLGFVLWRVLRFCCRCFRGNRWRRKQQAYTLEKHQRLYKSFKVLLFLTLLASIGLTIWAMVKLDSNIVTQAWNEANTVSDYVSSLATQLDNCGNSVENTTTLINRFQYIATDVVQLNRTQNDVLVLGQWLDNSTSTAYHALDIIGNIETDLFTVNSSLKFLPKSLTTLQSNITTARLSFVTIRDSPILLSGISSTLRQLHYAIGNMSATQPVNKASDPKFVTLANAVSATNIPSWSNSLSTLDAALIDFNKQATSTNGLASALQNVTTQYTTLMNVVNGGANTHLNALADALTSISTALPYLVNTTQDLVGRLQVVNTSAVMLQDKLLVVYHKLSNASSTIKRANDTLSTEPLKIAKMLTDLASQLVIPAGADTLLTQLGNAQTLLKNVPSVTPFRQYISNLQASLRQLSPPLTATSSAIAQYKATQTAATYTAMYATLPPTDTATQWAISVANPSPKPSGMAALQTGSGMGVTLIDQINSTGGLPAQSTYITNMSVQFYNSTPWHLYYAYDDIVAAANLELSQLPTPPSDLLVPVTDALTLINHVAITDGNELKTELLAQANDVRHVADDINAHVVEKIDNIKDDRKDTIDQSWRIIYGVIMGFMGLALLVIISLGISALANSQAGVCTNTLLLHILVVLYFLAAIATAIGLSVEYDVCPAIEPVILHKVGEKWQPLARYYFGAKPANMSETPEEQLQNLLIRMNIVNLTAVDEQVAKARSQQIGQVYQNFTPVGTLLDVLNDVNSTLDSALAAKDAMIHAASAPFFLQTYTQVKQFACCQVPNQLLTMWYAWTSAAWLMLGSCWIASFLLGRLDHLPSSGVCCTCLPSATDTGPPDIAYHEPPPFIDQRYELPMPPPAPTLQDMGGEKDKDKDKDKEGSSLGSPSQSNESTVHAYYPPSPDRPSPV